MLEAGAGLADQIHGAVGNGGELAHALCSMEYM
jgi:hypothetical protein